MISTNCDSPFSPATGTSDRIRVITKEVALTVGDSQQLAVVGANASVHWESDNPAVATVTGTGLLSAQSPGSARVIAQGHGGADTSFVTVRAGVPVTLISHSISLQIGQSARLSFSIAAASGDVGSVPARAKWSSSAPSIATIDSTGTITGVALGEAAIAVNVNGATDTSHVQIVSVPVAAIGIEAPSKQLALSVHEMRAFTAVASDSAGNQLHDRLVTWSSSSPDVVSVTTSGSVAALAPGTATITAAAEGKSDSIVVTVNTLPAVVAAVTVALDASTIQVGQTAGAVATALDASGNAITGLTVSWTSGSPGVASVSSGGLVKGLNPGTANITATVNAISSSATLVVTAPTVASVAVTAPSSSITAGQTLQATATVLDPSGAPLNTAVTWASSAPTVAGVSPSGLISGLNGGTATITASAAGKSGSVTVTVQAASTPTPMPNGATDAELPRVYLNTAMSNTPSAGKVWHVAAGGDLQAAIDAAAPGDQILLAAGATFRGNYVIRPKTGGISGGWITVMSDGALPAEGTRSSPTLAGTNGFPKLVSPTVLPALSTSGPAARWRFIGLEFTNDAAVTTVNGTVYLGEGRDVQTSLDRVPTDLILDRVYIHGQPTTDDRRCINFNGARLAIVDSYVSDCHSAFDAQAVTGTNGPGPFKIVNNYLEASGENIAWGGADPRIPDLVPSDIEIRHNHFFKPLTWKGRWLAKNLYESKNSRRVLLDGNVFENSWPDGQAGYAIVLWSVNQDGACSWCVTQDITFTNNVIKNATSGFQLSASAGGSQAGVPMNHVTIRNNVIIGLDNPLVSGGTSRLFTMNDIIPQLTIEHNTGFAPDATLIWGGNAPLPDHLIRNNLIGGGGYQIFTAYGAGSLAWAREAGPGSDFSGNVVALASDRLNTIPNNAYPQTLDAIGLVGGGGVAYSLSATLDQLALSSTSAYRGKATDGTNPGANISAVTAAIANVVQP